MTDYIKREAAIAAAFSANAIGNSALRDVYDTVERIRMIPAEDVVERKRGKWEEVHVECFGGGTITNYECQVCGEKQIVMSNFCPNCGAEIRGET